MKLDNLKKLFHEELKDIYDAELRLTKALPKMAKAAHSKELTLAFQDHLKVTQTQVGRLEQVFQLLGAKPTAKTCLGIKGLLEEGDEAIATEGNDVMLDLALIAAARRVEHYEMAAYLCLQDLASVLNVDGVEELINANLEEESEADDSLSALTLSMIDESHASQDESKHGAVMEGSNGKRKVTHA